MDLQSHEVSGLVSILDRYTRDNPLHEATAARRVVAEVIRAWPGEVSRLWWKWTTEASSSLGYRTKTLDCTLEEADSLAQEGARLVCFKPGIENNHGEWLAVIGRSKRGYEVMLPEEQHTSRRLSQRGFKKRLEGFVQDGRIRCVIIEQQQAAIARDSTETQKSMSPIARLLKLWAPEMPDVWLVIIFAFIVSVLMLATPMAVEALVNTVAFGRYVQPIFVLAVILLTFLGFQGALRALQTYVVEIIQRRLFARVAGDLAYRIPRVRQDTVPKGQYLPELVNRFFDVISVQKTTAGLMLDGIGLVLNTLIGMAVLGFYHPWLLGFDLFLIASIALIIFVLGRGAIPSAVKESKQKYRMASWLEDVARCPSAFHGDGGTDYVLERSDRIIYDYLTARRKHFRIVLRQLLFALALQAIASTVLLGLGGWLVVSGELTLGQLVAAELIVTVIVGSFAKFGKHMESFYDLCASVDKLGVLFDLPTERQDGMLAIDRGKPVKVELNGASYSWPGSSKTCVPKIDLLISGGSRLAILGDAGSGKSVVMDLLFGSKTATSGHLMIDGFDPGDLRPNVLRERISLARGSNVFQGSIEENVHLHREDVTANDVRDVLSALGVLMPILEFTDGCDTLIASDGAPLSENQCRLLNIARAAVAKPGLLLIDGSLDNFGDRELDRVLDYLCDRERPWTLVIATSREDIAARLDSRLELGSFRTFQGA